SRAALCRNGSRCRAARRCAATSGAQPRVHSEESDHRPSRTSLGRGVRNRAAPSAIFFPKTESDLMPTAFAGVRRLDWRGGGLLVRVKLVRGSTKANGRV